jgi:hypothetical protein
MRYHLIDNKMKHWAWRTFHFHKQWSDVSTFFCLVAFFHVLLSQGLPVAVCLFGLDPYRLALRSLFPWTGCDRPSCFLAPFATPTAGAAIGWDWAEDSNYLPPPAAAKYNLSKGQSCCATVVFKQGSGKKKNKKKRPRLVRRKRNRRDEDTHHITSHHIVTQYNTIQYSTKNEHSTNICMLLPFSIFNLISTLERKQIFGIILRSLVSSRLLRDSRFKLTSLPVLAVGPHLGTERIRVLPL